MFGFGLFELIIILMGLGLLLLATVAVLVVVLSKNPHQVVGGYTGNAWPEDIAATLRQARWVITVLLFRSFVFLSPRRS